MIKTLGVHHVGLTVDDLEKALSFFTEALHYQKVGEKPEYPAVFVSDGNTMLTLWQAKSPFRAFDRQHQIGLHHLAIKVDQADLDPLYEHILNWPGLDMEFPPEPLGKSGLRHMMCVPPGGFRLEIVGV